jgi:hypothetical protein
VGRRLALLVATYEYEDESFGQLTSPAHDAEALADVLRDPKIADFEVTTLINAAHHTVGEAIGNLYRDCRHDDLTVLYFTGHGVKDDAGRLYMATCNTRRDNLMFTSLPAEQIDQAMDNCSSRQKVLILDCCYSGAFPAGRTAKDDAAVHALERFQGKGRVVLTASDATQYAFEGDRVRGHAARSVFTRHLVAGLRDGSADLDGDGDITLDELYGYVHAHVIDEAPAQRPKKQDDIEGRLVIAQNLNWALPPYLSNALRSPLHTDRLGAVEGLDHLYRIGNSVVRDRVIDELTHLADDDSKKVSAKAQRSLDVLHPNELASDLPTVTEAGTVLDVVGRTRRGALAAGSYQVGHQELFVVTHDGHLCHRWNFLEEPFGPRSSSSWSEWSSLDAPEPVSRVACSSLTTGHIEVFAITQDGGLLHRWYEDRRWSQWLVLATPGHVAALATGAHSDGYQDLFVTLRDGRVFARHFPDLERRDWSNWEEWSAPDRMRALAWSTIGPGHRELFAVSHNGELFHRWRDPDNTWSDWYDMPAPGARVQAIAAGSRGHGYQDLFVTLQDGSVHHRHFSRAEHWRDWQAIETYIPVVALASSSLGNGHIELFATIDQGSFIHRWYWPVDDWTGWADHWP